MPREWSRANAGGVDTLQCQLGSYYHKLDHPADVSKSKVGDMVYVSNNGYRSPATATVIEVHRTHEGFVYKIKVKRTGQAEKEELVKEDALRHNVNYDNMYNPQQYYLDYHKRKEQEALAELVKAKETSHEMSPEECLRECYRLFRSLSQKYNDDSYASWKVKQSVSAAMKCLREKDVYAALKAMEEVKELA